MTATKAYAASAPKARLGPFSLERRTPKEHDVSIEIKYCGVCHSDIHQVREEWGQAAFPMVPGHEIAGLVTAVGSEVTKFKAGDQVGIGCFIDSCRKCEQCARGTEQYCRNGANWTYNSKEKDGSPTYGGYSERIVVDERYVVRIPENLKLDRAAPLLCAGITLYSPLRHWDAGRGKKVGIVGLGGLGHMGVKLAHAMGAEVTVLSQTLKKQADAKRLGADHFYATSERDTFARLKGQFDLIINTVSTGIDWNDYVGTLRVDGSFVVVGVPDKAIPVQGFPLIGGRKSIAGSVIGGIAETQEMLDFCGEHDLVSDIEITPIQKINEAYDRVVKSDVRYRFVIDIATLKAS